MLASSGFAESAEGFLLPPLFSIPYLNTTYSPTETFNPLREDSHATVEGDNAEFGDEQVVARTDESLSATLDGEAVLLQPEAGMYYGMNDVATVLWERLEEPATVANLRAELRSEFDVEAAVADRDLRAFLADLEAADLVEIREPSDAA